MDSRRSCRENGGAFASLRPPCRGRPRYAERVSASARASASASAGLPARDRYGRPRQQEEEIMEMSTSSLPASSSLYPYAGLRIATGPTPAIRPSKRTSYTGLSPSSIGAATLTLLARTTVAMREEFLKELQDDRRARIETALMRELEQREFILNQRIKESNS